MIIVTLFLASQNVTVRKVVLNVPVMAIVLEQKVTALPTFVLLVKPMIIVMVSLIIALILIHALSVSRMAIAQAVIVLEMSVLNVRMMVIVQLIIPSARGQIPAVLAQTPQLYAVITFQG